MSPIADRLVANLAQVRKRIETAARRSGRDPSDVTLVIVTKYAPLVAVQALHELEEIEFGESRPQQLIERASAWAGVRWHLIGHLQRNKVRAVLPHTTLIHSVDSLRLLERIGEVTTELGLQRDVLLEVNVSGESSKDGFSPDDLRNAWQDCMAVTGVRIQGLMTMAPIDSDSESARPTFRQLRELRDRLRSSPASTGSPMLLPKLSMGMSGDFETAIEEGATIVRIGSAVFEGVDSTNPR